MEYQGWPTMKIRRRLVRGSVVVLAASVATTGINVLTGIVVARLLDSPDLLGLLGILASLSSVFATVAGFGLPTSLTRYVAEHSGGRKVGTRELIGISMFLSIIIAVAAALGMFLASSYLAVDLYGQPELALLFELGSLATALSALAGALSAVLRGMDKMGWLSAVTLGNSLATLILSYVLVIAMGVVGAAWAIVGGAVAGLIISIILAARTPDRPSLRPVIPRSQRVLRPVLAYALPVFASGFVLLPAWWVAETFLALQIGFADVGLYRLGRGFYGLITSVPAVIQVPLMPLFAEMEARDPERIDRVFTSLMRIALLATLPVAVALALASRVILIVLYGDVYAGADQVTALLILSAVFTSLSPVTASLLLGKGRSLAVFWLDLVWSAALVPLSLVLISLRGLLGIGEAILFTGAAFFVVELWYFRHFLRVSLEPLRAPLAATAAVLGATLVLVDFFPRTQLPFLAIPATAIVGLGVLFILRPDERLMLWQSLRELWPL